ncbi:MAG: two-component sensor histidine kinase, partial [Micromonosporaceae bacterium]|nr:two-component sensor histidine kinase [Micromonosporaceae bacterium]
MTEPRWRPIHRRGRRSPRGRPWLRTLTARAVLVTCLASLVSVLVTAAVAAPLAVRSSNRQTRADLAARANL